MLLDMRLLPLVVALLCNDSTDVYSRLVAVKGSSRNDETGRFRQRRRTRAAIVAAAAELLKSGVTPSVNDVAEAADVSRRTVYLYFPTLEQLLLDATLGLLSQAAVDEAIDAADARSGGGDAAARVAAMIETFSSISRETLPLGRSLIRLTVERGGDGDGDGDGHGASAPRRGHRRVEWIERALAPLRDELDDDAFERLVSAMAMVVGWEALIVLHDLRGLPAEEQVSTSVWAANALIRAALDDAGAPS
jgi:AcrR family transcriptional regulator